jgi:hypothetical protein
VYAPRKRLTYDRRRTIFGLLIIVAVLASMPAWTQTNSPREFVEFRGTWSLDEAATSGLRPNQGRAGGLIDGLGFQAARELVIDSTPAQIAVVKDGASPEVYTLDGQATQLRDERTGALLNTSHRFTLVAGMLALTSERKTESNRAGVTSITTIITDAYRIGGKLLIIERQHSVLEQPAGHLISTANPSRRQVLIYHRAQR